MIYFVTEGDSDTYCIRNVYQGPEGLDIAKLKRQFAQRSLPPGTDTWQAFGEFLHDLGLVEVENDEIWVPDW